MSKVIHRERIFPKITLLYLGGILLIVFGLWVQPHFFVRLSDDGLHNPTKFFFNISRLMVSLSGALLCIFSAYLHHNREKTFQQLLKTGVEKLSLLAYTKHVMWYLFPLLLYLFLAYLNLTPAHNWDGDFAGFISQTQSIVDGTSKEYLQQNAVAMQESSLCIGPTNYPWGFPVLLLPFYKLFGLNVRGLKLITILAYVLFLTVLWQSGKKQHGPFFISLMLCIFALNPFMLMYMNTINSDITFMFFATLTMVFMGRIVVHKKPLLHPVADYSLLGALIVVSSVIRANGILLLFTLFLVHTVQSVQWLRKKKYGPRSVSVSSLSLSLLPYILFFSLTFFWNSLWPQSKGYQFSRELSGVSLSAFFDHMGYYFMLFRDFFSAVSSFNLPFFLLSIPVTLWGIRKSYRRNYHYIIFSVATFLLYCYWPGTQCLRALFSILPFYTIFFITGLEALSTEKRKFIPQRLWMPAVTILMLLLFFVTTLNSGIIRTDYRHKGIVVNGPHRSSCVAVFDYIKNSTTPDDVILFFKPRMLMLYAQRLSIHISEPERLTKGDYLMVHRNGDEMLSKETIESLESKEAIVFEFATNDYTLFRIVKQ